MHQTIGITGGIATGKSVVCDYLACAFDIPILDADKIVHHLMNHEPSIRDEIRHSFGHAVFRSDGRIDRNALGQMVFRDETARKRLEQIIHPHVIQKTRYLVRRYHQAGAPLVVVTAPLMIEAGTHRFYSILVVTTCSVEHQLERLIQNRGLKPEEAHARINAQFPSSVKIRYADVIINTDGTLEETLWQVVALMKKLSPGHPGIAEAPRNFKPVLLKYHHP